MTVVETLILENQYAIMNALYEQEHQLRTMGVIRLPTTFSSEALKRKMTQTICALNASADTYAMEVAKLQGEVYEVRAMCHQLRHVLAGALCCVCGDPLGTDEEIVVDDDDQTVHKRCEKAK